MDFPLVNERSHMSVLLFTHLTNLSQLEAPDAGDTVLPAHVAWLLETLNRYDARSIASERTGFAAVFENSTGLACALEIQTRAAAPMVCVAVNAGEDESAEVWQHTRLIAESGWGGQILVTPRVLALCPLPSAATLQDLGQHQFRNLTHPQKLYQMNHPQLPVCEFPPLRTLSAYAHNLPPQSTPFIGRRAELEAVGERLRDPECRIVVLVGQGGVGKTRVALQSAAHEIADYPDGVYYVPLAPLNSGERILTTIAAAIGCTFYGAESPQSQLQNYLREKQLLLVLDSFEHFAAHIDVLTVLLAACPGVKMIITSRMRLEPPGACVLSLTGLRYPQEGERAEGGEDYDAIRLFLSNARRVKPDFEAAAEDYACVAHICRMLEGSPLGIELASAWVRMLDCAEIGEEIENNLDFLTTSMRELPARHRSLRAVLESSWKLLSDVERAALKRLSVFRGGFQAEAAQSVAQATPDLLTALMNQSHLQYNEIAQRYAMPLSLRQYAEERLRTTSAELSLTMERLSDYCAAYLGARESDIQYARQQAALEEISQEIETLRAGWQWALEQQRYAALQRGLEPLHYFYDIRGWFLEGQTLFQQSIQKLQVAVPASAEAAQRQQHLLGHLHLRQGWFAFKLGDYETAETLANAGLAQLREQGHLLEIAFGHYLLGYVKHYQGDNLAGEQHLKEALRIYRPNRHWWGLVNTLNALGVLAFTMGDYERSRQLHEENLNICEQIGYWWGLALNQVNLGGVVLHQGEYEYAQELYQQSKTHFAAVGNLRNIGTVFVNLAEVQHYHGQYQQACELYQEGRRYYRESGHRWGMAYIDLSLSSVFRRMGDHAAAREYCLRGRATAEEVRNLWGISMAYILEGDLDCDAREYAPAAQKFRQAMIWAVEMRVEPLMLRALAGMARVALAAARWEEAGQWWDIVLAHPACERTTREEILALLPQLPAAARVSMTPDAAAQALTEAVAVILDVP